LLGCYQGKEVIKKEEPHKCKESWETPFLLGHYQGKEVIKKEVKQNLESTADMVFYQNFWVAGQLPTSILHMHG
jgi:hypothetical protein